MKTINILKLKIYVISYHIVWFLEIGIHSFDCYNRLASIFILWNTASVGVTQSGVQSFKLWLLVIHVQNFNSDPDLI